MTGARRQKENDGEASVTEHDPAPEERQTPEGGEVFLDHVGWYVEDMDACAAAFERLGFVLTPYTEHSHADADGSRAPSGTANRCAMLARGYLEFLTHVRGLDLPLARQLRDGLARYPGVHLIAFACADAAAEHARLAAEGFALQPLVRLRRPSRLDDGSEAVCAFTVIRPEPGQMAEGRIQMLTQETPEVVWQPSLIARDNGLDLLSGVVVCTEDPEEAAARFARFTGKSPRPARGWIDLPLDRGCVSFATPAGLPDLAPGAAAPATPFIAAVAVRSRDLAHTRTFLADRDVPFAEPSPGRLVVPAEHAMGATLVFHDPDSVWPGP